MPSLKRKSTGSIVRPASSAKTEIWGNLGDVCLSLSKRQGTEAEDSVEMRRERRREMRQDIIVTPAASSLRFALRSRRMTRG